MDRGELILKLSAEGRAWASALHVPALVGFIAWHLKQPPWVGWFKKKADK